MSTPVPLKASPAWCGPHSIIQVVRPWHWQALADPDLQEGELNLLSKFRNFLTIFSKLQNSYPRKFLMTFFISPRPNHLPFFYILSSAQREGKLYFPKLFNFHPIFVVMTFFTRFISRLPLYNNFFFGRWGSETLLPKRMGPGPHRRRLRQGRPVAYVHCVMHKCIMVKVGGNEKHITYVKST